MYTAIGKWKTHNASPCCDHKTHFLAVWQSEIGELERTREAMARELVTLANKNDDLEVKLKDYPEFQEKHTVGLSFF